MRQIGMKRGLVDQDISPAAIEEAISLLYTPYINKTIEETKFQILMPVDASNSGYISEAKELQKYNIDLVMCKILLRDCWAVFCPDTNDVFISEGI